MQNLDATLLEIEFLSTKYYRLLLLVGPTSAQISRCLAHISARLSRPIIDLNLSLSSALIDVPHRQRQIKVHKIVGDIIDDGAEDIVLIDKIDILFCSSLHLDVLALLKSLSRNKTVVAAWPGTVKDNRLQHAEEWHSEYQFHAVDDIKVVRVDRGNAEAAV